MSVVAHICRVHGKPPSHVHPMRDRRAKSMAGSDDLCRTSMGFSGAVDVAGVAAVSTSG